jgi:hypothetical protein
MDHEQRFAYAVQIASAVLNAEESDNPLTITGKIRVAYVAVTMADEALRQSLPRAQFSRVIGR